MPTIIKTIALASFSIMTGRVIQNLIMRPINMLDNVEDKARKMVRQADYSNKE